MVSILLDIFREIDDHDQEVNEGIRGELDLKRKRLGDFSYERKINSKASEPNYITGRGS